MTLSGLGWVQTDVRSSCEGAPKVGCFVPGFICQTAGSADIEGLEACVTPWEFIALHLTKENEFLSSSFHLLCEVCVSALGVAFCTSSQNVNRVKCYHYVSFPQTLRC